MKLLFVIKRFVFGFLFRVKAYRQPFFINIHSSLKCHSATIFFSVFTSHKRKKQMSDLKIGQQFTLTATSKDKKGDIVATALTWTVSDVTVLSLSVAVDGLSVVVLPVALGVATVTASLGSVSSAPYTVNVVPGDVVSIDLSASDPVD